MDSSAPVPEPPEQPKRLKLLARDSEDLAVLAAYLQDSIACVGEMAYLPTDKDRLDLRMEDFGPCWPTRFKPAHGAGQP
jgi:hypothetical protein